MKCFFSERFDPLSGESMSDLLVLGRLVNLQRLEMPQLRCGPDAAEWEAAWTQVLMPRLTELMWHSGARDLDPALRVVACVPS